MTEDEAVQMVLAMSGPWMDRSATDDVFDSLILHTALPRIQSALRLAEAVEWIDAEGCGVDGAFRHSGERCWGVARYDDGEDAGCVEATGETLPEAVTALRAKLDQQERKP